MRIISPGKPEKTGLRNIQCPQCEAIIEISDGDMQFNNNIRCPECGRYIDQVEQITSTQRLGKIK
jgi:predicted Zn finger-like uncharacterized protein